MEAGPGACDEEAWWGRGLGLLSLVSHTAEQFVAAFPPLRTCNLSRSQSHGEAGVGQDSEGEVGWPGREVPLWAGWVSWKEYRRQREPVPSETDAVPAGTPAPCP